MRSTTRKRDSGFTLIEILVALAVAGGALVLVLSANAASLERGLRARVDSRLERAAESKLAEWRIGAESSLEGPLPGFDGHRWRIRKDAEKDRSRRLARVTLQIEGADGRPLLERSELVQGAR